MDWRAYVVDFWGSILRRKFNMLAVTVFVATYFGLIPSLESLAGLLAFLLAYSSVYYYNDLLDYESDARRKFMPPDKLLYHRRASQRDYLHLLAWTSVLGTALCFLISPLLGVVTVLAVLLNHARTLLKNLFLRELLLGAVELLNFEAFWIAMYGDLIPGIALPIFVTYSAMYSLFHALYKLRSRPLLWAVRQWWVWLLILLVVVGAAFSIPLAASSTVHLFGLLLVTAVYLLIVGANAARYLDDVEGGMDRIFRYHDLAVVVGASLLVLIGAAVVYANLPTAPLPISPPREMTVILSEVDRYQRLIVSFML